MVFLKLYTEVIGLVTYSQVPYCQWAVTVIVDFQMFSLPLYFYNWSGFIPLFKFFEKVWGNAVIHISSHNYKAIN